MTSLAEYEVLEQLGSGAFGRVFKVRRKSDGKILVWKELNFGRMSEKEKGYLVSEVNIMRELKHPNIVRYHDRIIDKENATIYILMEYCAGGDLAALLKKTKRAGAHLEEKKIWDIFFQLVLALHDCHTRERKVIHRDLKPSNVFLDANHNVKLGDFGLACVFGENEHFAYSSVGTPMYLCPQRVTERAYNEKTDMWALGCVLYEMCALEPPFRATNSLALNVMIKAGKYQRIPERYSEELRRTIGGLLCVDAGPKQRWRLDHVLRLPEISIRMRERRVASQRKFIRSKEEELARREKALAKKEENDGDTEAAASPASAPAANTTTTTSYAKRWRQRRKDALANLAANPRKTFCDAAVQCELLLPWPSGPFSLHAGHAGRERRAPAKGGRPGLDPNDLPHEDPDPQSARARRRRSFSLELCTSRVPKKSQRESPEPCRFAKSSRW